MHTDTRNERVPGRAVAEGHQASVLRDTRSRPNQVGFLLSDRVAAPQLDQNVSSNVVFATGILIDLQPPKQMKKSRQNPSDSVRYV